MKSNIHKVLYAFLLVTGVLCHAQAQPWFKRVDSIPVYVSNNRIRNAWGGGINYGQFSSIDLNADGIKDLFLFDKTGNKVSTFLNKGTANTVDFHLAPEYRNKFPELRIWVLLVDYNCDGREDIFTYNKDNAGIKVFRNDAGAGGLKFTLAASLLLSSTGAGLTPVYVNPTDIPAVTDIDDDGDTDVLTFNTQGEVMYYHQNLSKETYGHCDSLKFVLSSACWGNFSEDPVSSSIHLGKTCKGAATNTKPPLPGAHAGACQLCFDLDGDKDKEIIISDFANPAITMLVNGGDKHTANMVSQQVNFPANTTPVNLPVFPCGFYLDVNNDDLKDLLVSPNILNNAENAVSVLYYKNAGTASNVVFEYQKNNFLQDEMIEVGEGAYPAFLDYNSDGLTDLLIGNYGYYSPSGIPVSQVALFENTGTPSHPRFSLVNKDFADLSKQGLRNIYPCFGDLDNDGDEDMLIGDYEGELRYYENTSGPGKPVQFTLSQSAYAGIDVGRFAMPQLIDVDRDGKLDLLIGSQDGRLNYYKNEGSSTSPAFKFITKNWGDVYVLTPGLSLGYSAPLLLDQNGTYKLLVGSESGSIFLYDNIDGNLAGKFTLIDSTFMDIWEGVRSAIASKDLNNDGLPDLVIGNYSGGVSFYAGQASSGSKAYTNNKDVSFSLYPVPASGQLMIGFKEQLAGERSIGIYNMLSQKLIVKNTSSMTEMIDVSGLPAGIYICNVSYKGRGEQSQRFTIQR